MEQILGLGDDMYRFMTINHIKTILTSLNLEELQIYMLQCPKNDRRLIEYENLE